MIRALLLAVVLAWCATAVAAPDPVAAPQRAFDEGEFEKAIKLAEKALKKKLAPQKASALHLLRGQSYAVLQKSEKAMDAFRSALELNAEATLNPETTPPDQIALFEAARAEVTGELSVTANREGAQVRIDGRPLGPVPLRTPVPVGKHEVEVSAGAQRRSETAVVEYRKATSVHLELAAEPVQNAQVTTAEPVVPTSGSTSSAVAPSQTVEARRGGGKGGSIALLVGGAALVGGGAFGAFYALGVKDGFDRQQDLAVQPTVTRAQAQQAQWIWPASIGAAAVGVGLAVFGVTGLLSNDDEGSGGGWMFSAGADGAAVGYGGAF